MKYQKGVMVRIHRAVFVKNTLMFPGSTSQILKIKLPKDKKDDIKDALLKSYPQYSEDYLLDPYKWFGKRHK